MSNKEVISSNKVEPTLFIGVGGTGSKIIKGVANLCKNDDKTNMRFVVLDTDTNDLDRLKEDGVRIDTVQTSSTRTIKDYLDFDLDAKNNWFPNNRILDTKTVSEGAGQVRAISRLALNATIRQGNIKKLYDAIDGLYYKDGKNSQKALKIILASTVTGGTGSGIATEAAMIVRDYIKTNYPQSSCIIRGFFIMPGVMKTVIKSDVEIDAQMRNGYATIKEINAFMMKGSGFFDSTPELKRYKDLCIMVPVGKDGFKKLDNLPFDFCFLIERSNEEQKSMKSLQQYLEFASHCVYEQNIGILRNSASSKEDNVIKEFINPDYLGRCRFGSVGASVLRYPYENIRDYIAYTWVQKNIIGATGKKDDASVIKNSWTSCDHDYKEELKKFENGSINDEPNRGELYIGSLDSNKTSRFGKEVIEKNLDVKYNNYVNKNSDGLSSKLSQIADKYIETLQNRLKEKYLQEKEDFVNKFKEGKNEVEEGALAERYILLDELYSSINDDEKYLEKHAEVFCKEAFWSENGVASDTGKDFSIESFLSATEKGEYIMHPNAVRCLLYLLRSKMEEGAKASPINYGDKIKQTLYGQGEDKEDKGKYKVGPFGKQNSLKEMCDETDGLTSVKKVFARKCFDDAQDMLRELYNNIDKDLETKAKQKACQKGLLAVEQLIKAYEKFYDSFENKVVAIQKKKSAIISDIAFKNGDCVKNLFASEKLLEKITSMQEGDAGSGKESKQLYTDIYSAIKENAIIERKSILGVIGQEATKDIFDDIIVEFFKNSVETKCEDMIDLDILHAIKFEYELTQQIKAEDAKSDSEKEELLKKMYDKQELNGYILDSISALKNLASPSLSKNDLKEDRSVEGISYSSAIKEGEGIYFSDFGDTFDKKNCTNTISKYELHCFKSTYCLEPNDISMLKYNKPDNPNEIFNPNSGDYFKAYQAYMEDIGPDSRTNPVITPHVDRRWNSISVMPELSMDWQRMLMGHIHEALFYGFLYKVIKFVPLTNYDREKKAYCIEYNQKAIPMTTPSGSKCQSLYEVMESLYFDRKAVKIIHESATNARRSAESKPTNFDNTSFVKDYLLKLKREDIVNELASDCYGTASVFEIPLLYYNSLPAKDRDKNEIITMINAILFAIKREIDSFETTDDANYIFGKYISEQKDLLLANRNNIRVLNEVPDDIVEIVTENVEAKLKKEGSHYRKSTLDSKAATK